MAETTETLLQQKLERGYRSSENIDNFVEEKELTVTITLAEYRKLVSNEATATERINKAEADKYSRNTENNKLKERIKELELVLLKYKAEYGALTEENTEESEEE